MLRLYLDEDTMDSGLVASLRAAGVDALTTTEAHRRGEDDASRLTFAMEQGRIIVTSNIRDFTRLHATWSRARRTHGGMVLVPQRMFGVGELRRRLVNLATTIESADMVNRAEYVTRWG